LVPVKGFFLVNLETLQCLSKYFFKKKKDNVILERDFGNKYAIKNKEWKPRVWRIYDISISYESCFFKEIKG
jgi:hypothetical protein